MDRHRGERRVPETMARYETRGTPKMVIIDKYGVVRLQQFGYFEPHKTEPLILAMLDRVRVYNPIVSDRKACCIYLKRQTVFKLIEKSKLHVPIDVVSKWLNGFIRNDLALIKRLCFSWR